uniref:Uncharacterized protein n=1 Tax=uncultured Thiotrichaceae bacterium TaxID=298394 RepID=A0A6S6UMU8_9GAMM|nr:MAG: Unknown protein [uncultured Thiotrichaceae bacterium]
MNTMNLFNVACTSLLISLSGTALQANETDPLSPSEQEKALSLSISVTSRAATNTQRRSTTNSDNNELLLIERRRIGKEQSSQRLADVYHYDYTENETIHTVINLDTQQVISTQHQQYLQLPLTENELQRASDIIFADLEEAALIKSEYQRITGQYLSSPQQLNIKAFAFSSDTLPEQLNPASQQCGLHRCAQVLLYTHDSIVFEISPIVNLSAGIVTQNIGY